MEAAGRGVQPGEAAVDVHEAGVVARGADFGARLRNGVHLFVQHGGGDFGVLDGEGAAEAAALIGIGEFDESEALDGFEQALRLVADVERAQGVAGGVDGDGVGVRGADIGNAEFVDEEFGELEDAREDGGDFGFEARFGRHFRVVVADHGDAGGGGRADHFGVPEDFKEVLHDADGFRAVAGVVVHLAAAGLGLTELDGVAEAFEDGDDGFTGFGEESVVVAGNEERDQHVKYWRKRA